MFLKRMGFIGFKRMGQAIAGGMIDGGHFKLGHFLVCSPSLMDGSRTTPFPIAESNTAVAAWADFLVLATKPAQIQSVCEEVGPAVQARENKPVVVSVAAGTLVQTIQEGLGCDDAPIIRAMTSTPSLVKKGMTVWWANPFVTPEQLVIVKQAFSAVGAEMQVDSEAKLDMATAISGSGPAYHFYMQECVIDVAIELGFSREEATILANQTDLGASTLAIQSDLTPSELREQVTSPNGTTAAGLTPLMDGRFKGVMRECIMAAFNRSIELGQGGVSPEKKLVVQSPDSFFEEAKEGAEAQDNWMQQAKINVPTGC